VTRTILDNPIRSVRVAWRHEERIFKVEIVPNPFGGVNTHLWRNEAYIVGIVPVVHPAYIYQRRNEKGPGGKRPPYWGHCFETEEGVLPITENSDESCN
jgi:hypothetical protein